MPHQEVADRLASYFTPRYVGTMVEVGAAHPESISTSFPLRELGWRIISIEPIPEFCEEFRKRGFPVLQYACYSKDEGRMAFKISPGRVNSSSLGVRHHDIIKAAFNWTDANFETIEVEALTLDTVLSKHHPELTSFDILSVDTEGWELEVMQGFDLKRFAPKVVCLESIPTPENQGSWERLKQHMEANGYELNQQYGVDNFFVPKR